jgi:hypothetical protein
MPSYDFTTLYAQYPAVIADMPAIFGSLEFIRELARRNQRVYIEALYAYREAASPFEAVHTELIQQLYEFDALVAYDQEVPAVNLFGQRVMSARWRKRAD